MKKIMINKLKQAATVLLVALTFVGCEMNALDPMTNEIPDPNAYTLPRAVFMGTTVKISGSFIVSSDSASLYLRPAADASGASDVKVQVPTRSINGWTASFKVPTVGAITEGKYNLIVKRGDKTYIIKRTLAAMSVFANESFDRTPIPGDEIIVSNCMPDTVGANCFGVGDEIVLKGIGFSMNDSLYFNPSKPDLRAAPYKVTETEARFVVPAGVTAGSPSMRFSNMPVYSTATGYKPSYITISGIKFNTAISNVANIVLPSNAVVAGSPVTITGTGFAVGDKVVLNVNGVKETITIDETVLPDLKFILPASYAGKTMQVLLARVGSPLLSLGFITTDVSKQNSKISNVVLPKYLPTGVEGKALSFLIKGTGFIAGDKIVMGTTVLTSTTVSSTSILATTSAAITAAGTYTLKHRRGTQPDEILGDVQVITAPRQFEYAEGGIVFWLDVENPVKGMVCHVKDAIPSINNTDTELAKIIFGIHTTSSGVTLPATSLEKAIGTGAANTQSILEVQKEFAKAAFYTDTLTTQMNTLSYTDWYLPSIGELTELFKARTGVDVAALVAGRTGEKFNIQASTTQSAPGKIPIAGYMSSSAVTFSRIWAHSFQNANQKPTAFLKTNYFRVRAVRSFNLTPAN
jgi:hypothetical protein